MGLESNDSAKGTKGQHVAREHDKITIPVSGGYTDPEHKGLDIKSPKNLEALEKIALAIMSPAGPCSLNPALLTGNIELEGEITEGSTNLYIGDE